MCRALAAGDHFAAHNDARADRAAFRQAQEDLPAVAACEGVAAGEVDMLAGMWLKFGRFGCARDFAGCSGVARRCG